MDSSCRTFSLKGVNMEDENLKQDKEDTSKEEYDFRLECFDIYSQLCDKAKEIIFVLQGFSENLRKFWQWHCDNKIIFKLSPIEQIFLIAIDFENMLNTQDRPKFRIEIQKPLICNNKEYIADFCILGVIVNEETINLKRQIIIECDGFDYHSSKEQMNYDYERELDMKMAGYEVIRFTGTQIYNDPFNCVKKARKYAEKLWEEQNGN